MSDEPSNADRGWLPPAAPGAGPAPRFERQAHHGWELPRPVPAPSGVPADAGTPTDDGGPAPGPAETPVAPPRRASAAAGEGPTFVKAAGPVAATGPRNRLAVASLVSGIVGLVVLIVSLGLWFAIAVPLSAAAWVSGLRARKGIAEGRSATGAGQARAGLVLGIVGVALGVVAAVVWLYLVLVLNISLDEIQRDLERELERQRSPDGGAVQALSSLWRLSLP